MRIIENEGNHIVKVGTQVDLRTLKAGYLYVEMPRTLEADYERRVLSQENALELIAALADTIRELGEDTDAQRT